MSDPIFARPITNPYPNSGEFADIDGDGDFDISYTINPFSFSNLVSFQNTGTTTSPAFAAAAAAIGTGFGGPKTSSLESFADIDGDGDLDAIVSNAGGSTTVVRNTGTRTVPNFGGLQNQLTNPFGLTSVNSSNFSTKLVDIDGDGDLDAFIGRADGNTVFFRNTGTTTAPAFATAEINPFGITDAGDFLSALSTFADIDGDGDLDAFIGGLILDNTTNRLISSPAIFFRNTGTITTPAFAAAETNPFGLTGAVRSVVDIDGDGDLDIFADGKLYRNTLTGTNISTARNDFNNDGRSDILWRNDNGRVAVWTMNGATVTSSALTSTPTVDNSWKVAGNSDFDGDGKADILWRNDTGATEVWTMNGTTVLLSTLTSVAADSSNWKIAAPII